MFCLHFRRWAFNTVVDFSTASRVRFAGRAPWLTARRAMRYVKFVETFININLSLAEDIYVRHHNRCAERLAEEYPSDAEVFQTKSRQMLCRRFWISPFTLVGRLPGAMPCRRATRGFVQDYLFIIFAANHHIWRPFPYPQPGDPVDGSYLILTSFKIIRTNFRAYF